MAWQYFPITMSNLPAKGLQAKEIWQELEDAVNERDLAIGGTGLFDVSGNTIEDELFSSTDLVDLQNKVRILALTFVDHTDNAGNWHGTALAENVGPNWTFGSGAHNILSSANANVGDGTNWTRKFGEVGNIQTAFGTVVGGDYAAIIQEGATYKVVEYLNELYRVLDLLRWTRSTSNGVIENNDFISLNGNSYPTADEAWSWLVTNWPGIFINDGSSRDLMRFVNVNVATPPGLYNAHAGNVRGKYRLIIPTDAFAHSVDVYAEGGKLISISDFDIWDDDGIGLLSGGVQSRVFADVGPIISTSHLTDFLGDIATLQDRPADPAPPTDTQIRGWRLIGINASVLIIKWDVVGGFSKVT